MCDILYKYALNQNNDLIDIANLTKANKINNEYICISCGKKLIPKLGDIKQHHFSHYEENICSKETYLHKLGKIIFYYNYLNCIDKNIEYEIEYLFSKECDYYYTKFKKLCNFTEEAKFNLIKFYPIIKYQVRDDNFIPDLLLSDKEEKDKIYIEIFVTHGVSYNKIESKNRIIEIKINEENDINIITSNLLSYKNNNIRFYNIQKKILKDNCNGNCKKQYEVIFLNKDNEIDCKLLPLNEINNDFIIKYYLLNKKDEYDNDLIKKFAAKCAKSNLTVKNCNICRYHMLDKYQKRKSEPIYCKFLNYTCSSFEAESCESYVQDYRIVNRIEKLT